MIGDNCCSTSFEEVYTKHKTLSFPLFSDSVLSDCQKGCKNRIIYVIQPLMAIESKTYIKITQCKDTELEIRSFYRLIEVLLFQNPSSYSWKIIQMEMTSFIHHIRIYTKYTEFRCPNVLCPVPWKAKYVIIIMFC